MNSNLGIAIKAAIEAGKDILKIYNTADFGVEMKSDHSPITKADKAAHLKICSFLEKTDYPILSEEGKHLAYNKRKNWKTFWLVDPLDGTKEFIKRNNEFTVNIALIEKNTPILGVVYVPVTGELYFADKEGSYKTKTHNSSHVDITRNVTKLPKVEKNNTYIVVASRSHINIETEDFINKIDTENKPLKIVSKGSSLKICQIAEGLADCYPRMSPTMEWDTAAGHAIVIFAGKSLNKYPENTPLTYNKKNLLNPYFVVK